MVSLHIKIAVVTMLVTVSVLLLLSLRASVRKHCFHLNKLLYVKKFSILILF
jgi:hypothetical protein